MDLLPGYHWQVRRRDIPVDAGDVVDAGPPPISVHGVETDEVFLSMACHLCWSS